MEHFFAELTPRLERARKADRDRYQWFFYGLAPRLEMARDVDRELDRKLAHRFNVLSYLRDDELGLSRIIADLLNPQARHGQGVLFLECLLNLLKGRFEVGGHFDEQSSVTVKRERSTKDKRRLDISVEIEAAGDKYCLAIENKPYARDQENQVKDYLEFLKDKYPERFLLIYLSPTGAGPSECSITRKDLEQWEGRFAIMPYALGRYGTAQADESEQADEAKPKETEQEDELKDFRIQSSLADWLGDCRKNCEVERLRWFLSDAEQFCQQTVGGQIMTTDVEKAQIKKFLLENPSGVQTAQAVHDAWPEVKQEICQEFFNKLFAQIQKAAKDKLSKFGDDIIFYQKYEGEKSFLHRIGLYRWDWRQYLVEKSDSHKRTSVRLENEEPNGWFIGVSSPMEKTSMEKGDKERREQLEKNLIEEFRRGEDTRWWPWYEYVDDEYKNWDSILPALVEELKKETGGEIMKYYVNKFIEVAEIAIPIIDEIEK